MPVLRKVARIRGSGRHNVAGKAVAARAKLSYPSNADHG